ncbi:MAG: amidohydrolase [Planctomycetes bacterium]|nr:amidohydrolase [Planctomycetota bacterium]
MFAVALVLASLASPASTVKPAALSWIDAHAEKAKAVNHAIWEYAEVGLQETKSSAELEAWLGAEGFRVKSGVAGMPTAFVAEWGSGKPIIGILAEYDALPGLSQKAQPTEEARVPGAAGHACGHSVFGTASTTAAIAVRHALTEGQGTIRLYGTPAEETSIGKIYMARDGFFDDCDVVLHWHASDRTRSQFLSTKAVVSAKFTFHGVAAHASAAPYDGKSALDAVELMDVGVNFYREHVKEDARIHYVITDGGGQPNVVPPRAQVWYYVRANSHEDVEKYFARVHDIAKGAALMTGTTVSVEFPSDTHELLPNRPLAEAIDANLRAIGMPAWTDEEKAFAREIQRSFGRVVDPPMCTEVEKLPEQVDLEPASTDVGDVSWHVPVGGLNVSCYANGIPYHSWPVVACTGMSIGEKGMFLAAKALAASAIDCFEKPDLVKAAKVDFAARRAKFTFHTLLPEGQKPPTSIR